MNETLERRSSQALEAKIQEARLEGVIEGLNHSVKQLCIALEEDIDPIKIGGLCVEVAKGHIKTIKKIKVLIANILAEELDTIPCDKE